MDKTEGWVPGIARGTLARDGSVVCLAGGLHSHFFFGPARPWERVMLIVAALVLIKPGWATDLIGIALVLLALASQRWVRRPATTGEVV